MRALLLVLLAVVSVGARAEGLASISVADIGVSDLVRLTFGEIAREPFVVPREGLESDKRFTLDLRSLPSSTIVGAVSDLLRGAGFDVDRRAGVVWVSRHVEQADELIVYHPRYRSARYLADVVQGVTMARSVLSRSIRQHEGQNGAQQAQYVPGGSKPQPVAAEAQGGPGSVEAQIDRGEVDQIAFNVPPKDAAKVRKLLAELDTPSGEVLLKAAVYEVQVGRQDGSAIQLALKLGGLTARIGSTLNTGSQVALSAGGLDVVLSALDGDSRFHSISRPQVRVKNGAQARFSVGQDVPVLGLAQVDKNGNPVQSVDYKQSGVILSAVPEIRGDVIELGLNQELSNFVVTATGVNGSPTLIKRSIGTKLGLVPGEVVIIGGLEDSQTTESADRLPLLGWLMGRASVEKRSEIVILLEVVKL